MSNKKSLWSLKLNTASIVLIPAAVAINYIGKIFAATLKLPLWLDSIGTLFAGMLGGPILGAISGLINNVIYGLTVSPAEGIYGITSVAIGIAAGIFAYLGFTKKFWKVIVFGALVACVSSIVSVPLNYVYYGGQTGNIWGDAAFAFLNAHHVNVIICSFVDDILVDLPDKIVASIVAYTIMKVLPQKLKILFDNSQETTSLD